jgi:dTDP-4-amino-4,6-dideoxygalactose transaminase
MINVLKPDYDERTKQELLEVLDSGWVGQGPKTFEFEQKFAEYVGAKYCVMTNSGTSALDLCLKVYDIHGGELVTTPMTFVSDAIVGEWNGMDVTFADIKEDDLCIDPEAINVSPDTKAVIAVDSHGRLADIKAIRSKFAGLIIEDAAHACYTPGAGQDADITIWSFQAVKSLPIFDGGAITTNDEAIYKKLRTLTWLGVEKSTWDRVGKKGYSWRYDITQAQGIKAYMTDVQSVIGLGQLRRLPQMLARRQAIQARYNEAFKDIPQIKVPKYSATVQYYTMQCEERDKLSEFLADKEIATSVHFLPLSETTYWKKAKKNPLPVTDRIWLKLLSLPVFNTLTDAELEYIINSVREFYDSNDWRHRSAREELTA